MKLYSNLHQSSHRKQIPLYVEVLDEFTPLFLAFDHINYVLWMTVHIRDMKSFSDSIKNEFVNCSHWVLSMTTNNFSAVSFHQGHDQENKIGKGSGAVIGLT